MKKYSFLILALLLLAGFILAPTDQVSVAAPIPTPTPITPINSLCPGGTNSIRMLSGFLSANTNLDENKFSTADYCLIGERATIPQFSIPSYDEMKSIYYDKSKINNKINISGNASVDRTESNRGKINGNNISAQQQYLINISGDLILDDAVDVKQGTVIVIFVGGNLIISANQTYNDPGNKGLVLVVSGNVNIDPNVTEINAFIITYGAFCSASQANGTCPIASVDNPLTIKGSVISLNTNQPPKFVRSLSDNTTPAEIIQYQPKYLVILRNIFSRTLTIWREIQ